MDDPRRCSMKVYIVLFTQPLSSSSRLEPIDCLLDGRPEGHSLVFSLQPHGCARPLTSYSNLRVETLLYHIPPLNQVTIVAKGLFWETLSLLFESGFQLPTCTTSKLLDRSRLFHERSAGLLSACRRWDLGHPIPHPRWSMPPARPSLTGCPGGREEILAKQSGNSSYR